MNRKMILSIVTASVLALAMTACGNQTTETRKTSVTESQTTEAITEASASDSTEEAQNADGLANPWTDSDQAGVLEATGFDLAAPDDASDVAYSYMADEKLAQMTFAQAGVNYTYRVQSTDGLTDISGMYYDWTSQKDTKVSNLDGLYLTYEAKDGSGDAQVLNWYDKVTGVTYSLSASADSLEGEDLLVLAESIYQPLQGEASDDPDRDAKNEVKDYFLGEHTRSEDGSSLTIAENEDGTYKVDISITRLCNLEDGSGTFKDHKVKFTVKDPSGNLMKGEIYRDSDNSLVVKFTDSTWDYLPNNEILKGFGK